MNLTADAKLLIAAGAVALAALYWITRPGQAASAGQAVGGAAVDLISGTASGVVTGAGALVGIPQTNLTQCEQDLAAGNTWAASFNCPAGTFIKGLFGG